MHISLWIKNHPFCLELQQQQMGRGKHRFVKTGSYEFKCYCGYKSTNLKALELHNSLSHHSMTKETLGEGEYICGLLVDVLLVDVVVDVVVDVNVINHFSLFSCVSWKKKCTSTSREL